MTLNTPMILRLDGKRRRDTISHHLPCQRCGAPIEYDRTQDSLARHFPTVTPPAYCHDCKIAVVNQIMDRTRRERTRKLITDPGVEIRRILQLREELLTTKASE